MDALTLDVKHQRGSIEKELIIRLLSLDPVGWQVFMGCCDSDRVSKGKEG